MLAGFKRVLATFQMVRLEDPDKQNILDRFKLFFVLFFNGFILFMFIFYYYYFKISFNNRSANHISFYFILNYFIYFKLFYLI